MDERQQQDIQLHYRHVWTLTVIGTVLITALRVLMTPHLEEHFAAYLLTAVLAAAVLVIVLVSGATKPSKTIVAGGKYAVASAAGAALMGATLLVSSLATASDWFTKQAMPYPSKASIGVLDKAFVYIMMIAGIAGGAYYLYLAFVWATRRCTVRGKQAIFSLLPVVWCWMRLIRYITSFVSAIGPLRNAYELGMILFEMMFLVQMARYLMQEPEKPSRFFVGVALCTGFLCAVCGFSRMIFFFLQDEQAFATCALVTAPDFGVAAFAFVTAFVQARAVPVAEEQYELVETAPVYDGYDGEGAQFLISDTWFEQPVFETVEQPKTDTDATDAEDILGQNP